MKKLLIIALLLLALLLVSCDGETPSESLPSESAPEVSTHVCDFSGRVKYDENGHFVTCECGEVSRSEHEMYVKRISRNPTCAEDGKQIMLCEGCQYITAVTIPKLEHTTVKHDEVPATCLKEGVSAYEHCDICNIDIGKTVLPKLEHDYKEDHYCTMCGGHEYITFEKSDYGWIVTGKDTSSDGVEELYIPTHTDQGEKVVGIGRLQDFKALKKVTIPDGIKYLLSCAFCDCYNLKEVVFLSENTIVEIGGAAFSGCSFEKITLPEKCIITGQDVFSSNKKLRSIFIPEGTTKLGERLFEGCTSLKTVTIPNSVTTVDRYIFKNCYSLKEVDLGNGITKLSYEIFRGCSALETIVIPDSVTDIDRSVFYGCDELKNVVLSKNLKVLNDRAFTACTSLESITIPKSVEYLGSAIFENCNSLKEINYEGTIEEWNNIPHVVDKKKVLSGSKVEKIICSDGVIEV